MFAKTVTSMRVRDWVLLMAASFFVSFCGVFGWSYGAGGTGGVATLPPFSSMVLTLVFTIIAALVILLCNAGLTKLAYASLNRSILGTRPSRAARFCPVLTVRSVMLFAGVLILFWLPYLIAVFPGITYADTDIQMEQLYAGMHPLDVLSGGYLYMSPEKVNALTQGNEDVIRTSKHFLTDAWILDHQPFALTLLYGNLALASDALFGNWMPALGLLMVVQVVLFSLELSFAVAYLRSRKAPIVLCLVLYLFFCLMPLIPLTAGCIMKDAVFTLFTIPFLLLLTETVLTRGALFRRKSMVAAFILVGIGMCLSRKSGLYVVLGTAAFGCVAFAIRSWRIRSAALSDGSAPRGEEKRAAATFFAQGTGCAVLMFALIPGIVYPAFDIAPGGRQEMLGTLFQQTARVYAEYGPDALTPEERKAVEGVLRVSNLALEYNATITDRAKEKHYLTATDEELRAYLDAYFSMGLRFPESYFGSVMCTAYGYLSPLKGMSVGADPVMNTRWWTLEFEDDRPVAWPIEETWPLRSALTDAYHALDGAPVVGLLFRGVLYDLWIPVLMLFFCLRNRLRGGVMVVPFAMIFAVCLVSPLYDLRYIFPVVMAAPLLIGAMVALAKRTFKERADGSKEA